ncbi:MAG TPA: endolytic transglycosylase MltG [Fimbriimonadaceae bacterium]|nr:endolytic transglycosylase MltG [Fimbriimonadaceae bacterium]
MIRKRRWPRRLAWTVLFLVGMLGGAGWHVRSSLDPTPPGPERYYIVTEPKRFGALLVDLEQAGIVRNAKVASWWARYRDIGHPVAKGTYRIAPGVTLEQISTAFKAPLRQMVRIPEGRWIARVAKVIDEKEVASAEDYIAAAHDPQAYRENLSFPLPKASLEGYLFPDTYDLPPLLGADATVRRQLQTFEKKVVGTLGRRKDLHRLVIIASMVEAETALDRERPIVAGVIMNRLKKGMTLDIDATVLYALQEWKELGPGVVKTVQSPYNTYLNAGLPPGPICSPGLASLKAAAQPAKHPYLYYVAMPDKSHLFSTNYDDHRANIRKSRAAFAASRGDR